MEDGFVDMPGHPASVQNYESVLPWLEEEHGSIDHPVSAVEFVDGARKKDRSAGVSEFEILGNSLQGL